ncbi:MAG: DNA-binding FadR family transcriptional regulator [Myxococcota bacterium]
MEALLKVHDCVIQLCNTLGKEIAMTAWASRSRDDETVAQRIERRLTVEILSGERAPGSRLPSIRALAVEAGTTPPTIQRVIAGLERTGLVCAVRGSGVRVNDPARCGDLSLAPLWMEAYAGQPQRQVAILADFLELRRVIAAHLVRTRRAALLSAAPRLALAATLPRGTLGERLEADLAFSRAVLEAAGQSAAVTIFNTVERLVREVPYVAESFYDDPESHQRALLAVVAAVASGGDGAEALEAWDETVLARFGAYVTRDGGVR